ncbi:MAG: SRPBCC family protein [Solirubrobacterales bacterium]
MGWWSYERTVEIDAALVDAWHYFSDLEGVVEWNDNLVGHEILTGPPNEAGSVVVLHYDHGGKKSSTTVTTLEREDLKRIEQKYVSDGNESIGTAVFQSIDFDSTQISMTIRFDMSNFSLVSRPLRKTLVKIMARDMMMRFGDFMTERRVAQLVSDIKEESL